MEELIRNVAKAGIQLEVFGEELRIKAPEGALTEDLKQSLRQNKSKLLKLLQTKNYTTESYTKVEPDPEHIAEPFPLTDLQHAYWLGRDNALEMGSVSTHLYVEFDCADLDVKRLNQAFCMLIQRHGMLRAIVGRNGLQRILTDVPEYEIAVDDQSSATPELVRQALQNTRDVMSHEVRIPDQWPLFQIRTTVLPDSLVRLHVSLDLLIFDALSIAQMFREWHQLYENSQVQLTPLSFSFRDYVLAEEKLKESSADYHRAEEYWQARIDSLPPAPDLPLRADLSARQNPRFSRREFRLPKAQWEQLKTAGRGQGLTPSGMLLAMYSEVLARWSLSPHFTLNMTVSSRLPLHDDVEMLLGDFINLLMLEVDRRDQELTFLEFAQLLQKQLGRDMEHSMASGVKVLREWAKTRGVTMQATMPVVFSSGLVLGGDEDVGDLEQFGPNVYGISQTSQVWLDQHVVEIHGDLVLVWDAVDAVFEEGVLDGMFSAYCHLIKSLVENPENWHQKDIVHMPAAMWKRRLTMNQPLGDAEATTDNKPVESILHAGFVEQALANPSVEAILSAQRCLNYGELLRESCALADQLLASGVSSENPIAVIMKKGWEQVVAVYGILLAGGIYMPVDADLPAKRQRELLHIGRVKQVVTQPGIFRNEVLDEGLQTQITVFDVVPGNTAEYGNQHAKSLSGSPTELAYIIFTSGTTGTPKGVMIDHLGAVNTINAMNRLFNITNSDRVLGVSSLSFDLSVYDIFGLLAAGGALVIPEHGKGHDPLHWRELIEQHGITLWNSAPQLMRMLMDSFNAGETASSELRTVLLSGDWIPLDLADRIRNRYVNTEVISLGGATEASIWSIYYPIGKIQEDWVSIPYGKPLPNQTIWVYDYALRPCPDGVTGRIFIGGKGVAKGYWQDKEKTDSKFIIHPGTGERLYDTGDLGRYSADGNVQMLGRDDRQIKIRGYRVEMGEIETVLRRHPNIARCAVTSTAKARDRATDSLQLIVYIEFLDTELPASPSHLAEVAEGVLPQADNDDEKLQVAKDYLAEYVPDYMVPQHFVTVDHIPLSVNGKINYQALPDISAESDDARHVIYPRNQIEQLIYDAWTRVIVDFELSVTDNFFELGGDSVIATQLLREINDVLPFELEMHELFENLTIESLAELFLQRHPGWLSENTSQGNQAEQGNQTDNQQMTESGISHEEIVHQESEFSMHEDIRIALANFDALNFAQSCPAPVSEPGAVFLTGGTGWIGAHVLAALLATTEASIYCLVQGSAQANGQNDSYDRLINNMRHCGIQVNSSWPQRVIAVNGDLSQPNLGLKADDWQLLAELVDAIYHFGASVNVMVDYAQSRKANVNPLVPIVDLALQHHMKPVFFCSPMAVCRRQLPEGLKVLTEERFHPDTEGLATGYAQSKWVGERILLAAGERGLPVKIYRTSHALPSSVNGLAKTKDTYGTVLKAACRAAAIPDWNDSVMYGVPVDILGQLIVEDSVTAGAQPLSEQWQGIVHLENQDQMSIETILQHMLDKNEESRDKIASMPMNEWAKRCSESLAAGNQEEQGLARMLFTDRASGTVVETMFARYSYDTDYFHNRGEQAKLSDLTPAEYWNKVRHHPEFDQQH